MSDVLYFWLIGEDEFKEMPIGAQRFIEEAAEVKSRQIFTGSTRVARSGIIKTKLFGKTIYCCLTSAAREAEMNEEDDHFDATRHMEGMPQEAIDEMEEEYKDAMEDWNKYYKQDGDPQPKKWFNMWQWLPGEYSNLFVDHYDMWSDEEVSKECMK